MMRDFNFFSEYVYVNTGIKLKHFILPLIYVVLIAALVFSYYYMNSNKTDLQATYEENNQFIESKEYTNVLAEAKVLSENVESLVALELELGAFKASIPYRYRVTEELLGMILGTIPRNVAFNNYNINSNGVIITAVSSDYSYIAEVEYNLRSLDIFDNVFIKIISSDEVEGYSFNIELTFGGEDIE
jgi:hypothetical protein